MEAVRAELLRRRLTTLEQCRALWEATADPFALCAALTLTDMPAWLVDGLLVALTPPTSQHFPKRWREGMSERTHSVRAWELIQLRHHPARDLFRLDWERAPQFASGFLRKTDVAGTPGAIRQSYMRVAAEAQRDPWRYWCTPTLTEERLNEALASYQRILESMLERVKIRPPKDAEPRRRSMLRRLK